MAINEVRFGVGCFSFGIKTERRIEITGTEYINRVSAALQRLSSVSSLQLDADDWFKSSTFAVDAETPELNEDEGFFPFPQSDGVHDISIFFDLHIPERVQKDLLEGYGHRPEIGENFRVLIMSPYDFPVTFVELLDSKCESPSTAVLIVRRFLKREIASISDTTVRFECLGPSPFHAEFTLCEDQRERSDDIAPGVFRCEHHVRRGYDVVRFYFDPTTFDDISDAKLELFEDIKDELASFYVQRHSAIVVGRGLRLLHEQVDHILSLWTDVTLAGRFRRTFTGYKLLHEIVVSTARFDTLKLHMRSAHARRIKELEKADHPPYLAEFFQRIDGHELDPPTNDIREIITLLEQRRSQGTSNLIAILAGVLGGIAGAAATIAISK